MLKHGVWFEPLNNKQHLNVIRRLNNYLMKRFNVVKTDCTKYYVNNIEYKCYFK